MCMFHLIVNVVCYFLMLFMAITSTGSAECIAVSSLVAYDIYREYFNKNATGADILRVSRITILVYGILQGALAALLQNLGIGIGWMYNFMGIMIGRRSPLLTLTLSRQP